MININGFRDLSYVEALSNSVFCLVMNFLVQIETKHVSDQIVYLLHRTICFFEIPFKFLMLNMYFVFNIKISWSQNYQ